MVGLHAASIDPDEESESESEEEKSEEKQELENGADGRQDEIANCHDW